LRNVTAVETFEINPIQSMNFKTYFLFTFIALVSGAIIWTFIDNNSEHSESEQPETADVIMYKNPGCQCCDKWAEYMQGAVFSVAVQEAGDIYSIKKSRGIPDAMSSCHTALIDGYVVEGHVPLQDINRLLAERPNAIGLAAPGMPASAPGMNTALNEPYAVYLIDSTGTESLYARH